MRARSFLILSAITVVVTAAAIVAVESEPRPQAVLQAEGPMFPGLIDRLGDIATIAVAGDDGPVTITRSEQGWVVDERGNWPANIEKVRDLVRGLTRLQKEEPKTTRADRYARIDVEDAGPGSTSKRVTLKTASGASIADIIVGKAGPGTGQESSTTFVRFPGDTQAWLAKGSVDADAAPKGWLVSQLFAIPDADIRQVRVVHPDKSTVTVVREHPESATFVLKELSKDSKLKRPDAADSVIRTFSELNFEDLVARQQHAFPDSDTRKVTIDMMDGRTIAFELVDSSNERWLRFVGDTLPPGLPASGRDMAFRVPAWKVVSLERKASELMEPASGS